MNDILTIAKELIQAWKEGGSRIRFSLIIASLSILVAFLANLAAGTLIYYEIANALSTAFGVLGGAIALIVYLFQKSKEEDEQERRVEQAEQRVQDNPKEAQAAWDLARIKLESYLNRNLSQVRSIFWLTLLVMMAGFALVGVGVVNAFDDPEKLKPALLSAVTGILINFIGATFLALYKSTMNQAKDYVAILERINAVGMSVQILDKLEDANDDLKHKTTADISKQLLDLYKSPIRP